MDGKTITTYSAIVLLAAAAATGFAGWYSDHARIAGLKEEIAELKKNEMRSAIDKSISAQMEEIAYEQKEISDEQREEALEQTRVANEMRRLSEIERMKAIEAEHNAVVSEKKALEASAIAESQRIQAEHQRIQAEFSKRVADTLSYVALGRSLGSLSYLQLQAGNDEMASMLSYASYIYTSRYQGDVYDPAVFRALINSSQSVQQWTENSGSITNIISIPGESKRFLTVSNYGEVFLCEQKGNQLSVTPIVRDSNYDFRDITVNSTGTAYAVSRTGHLFAIKKDLKTQKLINLRGIVHPFKAETLSQKELVVVGEQSIGIIDTERNEQVSVWQHPCRITLCSRKSNHPIIFDDQGKMHLIKGKGKYITKDVPVKGKVTAYAESKNTGVEVYGMSDGNIYLVDVKGKIQKLIGHQSRISKLKLNGRRLYSSSYDGSMKLWITDKEKVEPVTLISTSHWLMHFNFDGDKKTIWLSDAQGRLIAINVWVDNMLNVIKNKIRRNFTPEEWNYYIGSKVDYEPHLLKGGKEETL